MNQTLTGDFAVPMNEARGEGLFVSLCTIREPDGTFVASGAPVASRTDPSAGKINVPGLINIPCTKPPQSTARILATEAKSMAEIMAMQFKHVLLNGYFPSIELSGVAQGWDAFIGDNDGNGNLINGFAWDILGAESDSHEQMTRIGVKLPSLG